MKDDAIIIMYLSIGDAFFREKSSFIRYDFLSIR